MPHWCKISRPYLVPFSNYWTLSKTSLKKIDVLTTSLKNARVTKLSSHDHIFNIIWVTWKNFIGDVVDRNFVVMTIISKYFRRWRVASFADNKISAIFIKTTRKDSKKGLETIKIQFVSLFLDITKFDDFQWKNADVSRTQGMCQVICIVFESSLSKVWLSSFIIGYVWQILERLEQPRRRPSWIELKFQINSDLLNVRQLM